MFEVNTTQLQENLIADLAIGLTPMVTSSPGMGKSDIIRGIAQKYKLKLLDIRVSQCEPVDMQGFPAINEKGRMTFHIPEYFPIEDDVIPEGYEGWLIFLDEFNAGNKQTEAAAYKIILDREVYKKKLHKKCAIIAAGNLTTDRAIVNNLSTATMSRLIHYKLIVDHNTWLEWALLNNIDERIVSFIKFKPDLLHKFHPTTSEMTFPCPRTWAFASRIITGQDIISQSKKNHFTVRLAGAIGEGAAVEFMAYSEIYKTLPSINQILADPINGWQVPEEPSERYAITTMLAYNANSNNITTIVAAIERLPLEFQIITLQDIYKKHPELKTAPAIKVWIANNASEVL